MQAPEDTHDGKKNILKQKVIDAAKGEGHEAATGTLYRLSGQALSTVSVWQRQLRTSTSQLACGSKLLSGRPGSGWLETG